MIVLVLSENPNGLSLERAASPAAALTGNPPTSPAPHITPAVVNKSRRERPEVMVAILMRRDYLWCCPYLREMVAHTKEWLTEGRTMQRLKVAAALKNGPVREQVERRGW